MCHRFLTKVSWISQTRENIHLPVFSSVQLEIFTKEYKKENMSDPSDGTFLQPLAVNGVEEFLTQVFNWSTINLPHSSLNLFTTACGREILSLMVQHKKKPQNIIYLF